MNKWNVCNSVFAIMLQNNGKKFPIFISDYFSLTPNLVEEVSSKMNKGAETYIQRNYLHCYWQLILIRVNDNPLFLMELFIAIGLPIVLLFGLTLLFISDGIPSWVQQFYRNSSTLWNFGIVAMSTMALITYLARR